MLTFESQEKIIGSLLQKPGNKSCADCGASSPTWASLDFGVFVCSNCSGAHRALGPTITRIKSIKLDSWNTDWVQNMKLGNQEINKYWEADAMSALVKKPKSGASLSDHNRYVQEKYMKKKYVVDKTETHPLALFKTGKWKPTQSVPTQKPTTEESKQRLNVQKTVKENATSNKSEKKNTESLNLLEDDDFFNNEKHVPCKSASDFPSNKEEKDDQEQFTDFISGNENYSTERQESISFEELLKNPQPADKVKPQTSNQNVHNNLMQFHNRPYHHQTHSQQHYHGNQMYHQPHFPVMHHHQQPYQAQQYQPQQPQYNPQYNHESIKNFTLK